MQTGDINRALIKASQEGCIEKVTVLLDLGVDVNYQDEVNLITKYWHTNSHIYYLSSLIMWSNDFVSSRKGKQL